MPLLCPFYSNYLASNLASISLSNSDCSRHLSTLHNHRSFISLQSTVFGCCFCCCLNALHVIFFFRSKEKHLCNTSSICAILLSFLLLWCIFYNLLSRSLHFEFISGSKSRFALVVCHFVVVPLIWQAPVCEAIHGSTLLAAHVVMSNLLHHHHQHQQHENH